MSGMTARVNCRASGSGFHAPVFPVLALSPHGRGVRGDRGGPAECGRADSYGRRSGTGQCGVAQKAPPVLPGVSL